jgi:hypothetical protein
MNAWYEVRGVRVGAVLAVAAVAGFLVWLLVIRSDDNSGSVKVKAGTGPALVSEADISALADKLGQPVYWAGSQPGTELELTDTADGRVYVRYLTGNASVADPKPAFLTVGTYPFKGAFEALQKASQKPGAVVDHADNGGLVVTNRNQPTSVYLAYPDENFQVEVYDPDPKRALSLVTSGVVTPVS